MFWPFKIKREGAIIVPKGTFEAPKFSLEKGNELGYHLHLRARNNGQYSRTKYAITIIGGSIVIFEHGDRNCKSDFKLSDPISKSFIKEIEPLIREELKNVPLDAWRPAAGKFIRLFDI